MIKDKQMIKGCIKVFMRIASFHLNESFDCENAEISHHSQHNRKYYFNFFL